MNYQEAVKRTMPEGLTRDERLSMLAMGLAGESGEVVDAIKKHLYQGHDLNTAEIMDECGDVLWYLTNLLSEIDVTIAEAQICNIEKLMDRYPRGFDAERSVNRSE